MVQQQLVDYIKSQMKLSVDADSIKSSLLAAGWADADVIDSIKDASGAPAPAQPVVTPKETAKMPMGGTVNFGGGKQSEIISPIVVSDLVSGSKPEIVMSGKEKKKDESKPAILNMGMAKKISMPKFNKTTIIIIALAVLAAAGTGGAVFFYLQNQSLSQKSASSAIDSAATAAQLSALNAQVSSLTKERDDLKSSADSLTAGNKELLAELSFVAVPPGASSTQELSFDIKGVLAGGGKIQYTLTTENGVKIYVKNYKDTKVDAALLPLVGQNVEVSGTHLAGSRDITITAVNGSPVQ